MRFVYALAPFFALGCFFFVAWWFRVPRPDGEVVATATPEPPPEVLMLPTTGTWTTLVAIRREGPPPWPHGNRLSLCLDPKELGATLDVINMRAENFYHITGVLALDAVMVRRIGDCECLIIDSRIPREWFCGLPPRGVSARMDRLGELYPDAFRPE